MRSTALVSLLFMPLPFLVAAEVPPGIDGWEAVRVPARPFEVKDLEGRPLRLAEQP